MQQQRTRSARHIKNEQNHPVVRARTIAPLIGTSLLVGPMVLTAAPNNSYADEYVTNQATYSPESFVETIGYTASQVASDNDLYASVMIAQALLESGYGTSGLASAPYYNLFGVKGAYNGQSTYLETQEYLNGQWVTMYQPFRQYASYWESLQDHANVLRSTSFSTGNYHYAGAWKSQTTSYYDATAYLTGRYATDPAYAQKLNALITTYNLTRFDTPSTSYNTTTTEEITSTTVVSTSTTYSQTTTESPYASSGQTYTVQSGDTLWDIAQRLGTSVDSLMAINGLSDTTLMIGDVLSV